MVPMYQHRYNRHKFNCNTHKNTTHYDDQIAYSFLKFSLSESESGVSDTEPDNDLLLLSSRRLFILLASILCIITQ